MGLLDAAKQWMTPERQIAMQGIGMGLSQMAVGQPANLSPAYAALQQRQQSAALRKVMDAPGMMDRFTPEQQTALAAMPESLATQIIMQTLFAPPPEPVRGIEVGGNLVNPITGEEMYRSPDEPNLANLQHFRGADGVDYSFNPMTGTVTPLGITPDGTADLPLTRQVTLPDGSEAMVQWNPETKVWDPAAIPEGGTAATPKAKLTESQARITLFKQMQDETSPVLDRIETQYDPANISDAAARSVPIAGNYWVSQDGQIYQTAAAAWAESALRISTGAAATAPEIERVIKTYFAQPGDSPETVTFKRQQRKAYERSIRAALGEKGIEAELALPGDTPPQMPGDLDPDELKWLEAN